MHPATRYGTLLARDVYRNAFTKAVGLHQMARASTAVGGLWKRQDCWSGARAEVRSSSRWQVQRNAGWRSFSLSARQRESDKKDEKDQPPQSAPIHLQPPPPNEENTIVPPDPELPLSPTPPVQDASPSTAEPQSNAPRTELDHESLSTPASRSESLPSAFAQRRTEISRRMSHLMDDLLTKATLASQQINTYTGTDFRGIEALRSEIVAQEKQVKARHAAVNTQKDKHMEAHVKQASSQKEIVSLLERKSSWSPSDLERYMTLVRSEHLHEQAVQKAKEDLADAERELEDTRAMLEKLERKQYHEEQIWSDTIRRNSTWVTIGLMGVNIFLLLAQIIFFEPYRRRKIVREMKAALDERTVTGTGIVSASVAPEVANEVEQAEKAQPMPAEVADVATKVEPVPVEVKETEARVEPVAVAEPPLSEAPAAESTRETTQATSTNANEALLEGDAMPSDQTLPSTWNQLNQASSWEQRIEISKAAFLDLFSDRIVELKKVDVTTIAMQGAATGIATVGVLFLLLRPQ